MEKKSLKIQEVEIREIPGFPDGLHKKTYQDIDKDIVLVIGPNASGKSSTIRALQQALWQGNMNKHSNLTTRFRIGDDTWEINLKHGSFNVFRNGEKTGEGLPRDQFYQRYNLGLNELLTDDEKGLAEQMQKEIYGGIKIDEVLKVEGYRKTAYTTQKDEYKKYKTAIDRVNKITDEQKNLTREQEKLAGLRVEYEKSGKEFRKKEILENAISLKAQHERMVAAKVELEKFDPIMEKLLSFPREEIEEWGKTREELRSELLELKLKHKELEEKIQTLKIKPSEIENNTLIELEQLKDEINRLEERVRELHNQKSTAKLGLEELSRAFGYKKYQDIEEWNRYEGLRNFEYGETRNLNSLLEQYQRRLTELVKVKEELVLIESQRKHLENTPSEEEVDKGIHSLVDWLKEQKEKNSLSATAFFLFIGLITLLLSLIAFFYDEVSNTEMFISIGVFLFLSVVYYFVAKTLNKDGEIRKKDYKNSGLENHIVWESEAVSKKIDALLKLKVKLKEEESFDVRETQLKVRRDDLDKKITSARTTLENHKANLSNSLDLNEDAIGSNLIKHYVDRIEEWQETNTVYLQARRQLEISMEEKRDKMKRFNELLSATAFKNCETSEQVSATYSDLNSQYNEGITVNQRLSTVKRDLKRGEEELQTIEEKIRAAYANLGRTETDQHYVQSKFTEIRAYNDAVTALREAEAGLRVREGDYQRALDDTDSPEDYLRMPMEELHEMAEASANAGERQSELGKEITTIKTKIEETEKKNELERAIRERDEAEEDLKGLFVEDLSKNIGKILLEKLQSHHRQENQPEILQNANKILREITKGKYEISMSAESDKSVFMGFDTVRQRKIPLKHLSTGTRIHLLMALRLASIEAQEKADKNWKMPIFADELLANSDELRAGEIIKTLLEISKRGRQIFYFTAQEDELKKWILHLRKRENEVNYKVVYIDGKIADESYVLTEEALFPDGINLKREVPAPESVNKEEYKSALEDHPLAVKSFHLLRDKVSEAHLWYFMEDMVKLHELLSHFISTYAQLETMAVDRAEYRELLATHKIVEKARFLERYQELYKKGRPIPVNRRILLDNKVTKSKIDEVMVLLEELDYDPQRLIEKITSIYGIAEGTQIKIEESLLNAGYLPDTEPLTEEEVLRQLKDFLRDTQLTEEEAEEFLKGVVDLDR